MTRDFGGRDRPTWRAGQRLAFVTQAGRRAGLLIAFVIFAALPSLIAVSPIGADLPPLPHRPFSPRPCRPIDLAAFNRGWTDDPRIFRFEGVTFARHRGDADCTGRKGRGDAAYWPSCDFDAPFQVAVLQGRSTAYFAVPPGFTARVEVRPGAIRCTVTSTFDLPLRLAAANAIRSRPAGPPPSP
jgi:hypothetical protein